MSDPARPFELVVVGASAGGVEALSRLATTLPVPFPAPIVIAQHLDPRRPSRLDAILARRTDLDVRMVEDVAALEPGVIYVVPSNHHVDITDHEVRVTLAPDGGPQPSIDRLLQTAAGVFGESLIAVILTGMGSDGAVGAGAVKAAGGTVIVQSAETASFPAMPNSLAPSHVDIVAALDAIGPLLQDLVTGTYTPSLNDDERTLRNFLAHLRERTGIDFASYKRPTIVRRLQRRMMATGKTRLRDYVRFATQNEEEHQRLTSAFLIKVTEFFRDADLFEHLRHEILPRLIAEAREHDNELRIWSAGCATGEEAYSLAMLVCEALGDDLPSFHVRIFATDLDNEAIAFARRGVYPATGLAAAPPEMVDRYFTRNGDDLEIRKFVRAMMVFGQHDLGQRAPFPRIDLALCRNVLIYFTPELQKRALQLFAFSLREGGYLVLGKAESTLPLADHFVLEHPRLKIYRRHGDQVLIPPARIRDSTPVMPARPTLRSAWPESAALRPSRDRQRLPTGGERAENLLLRLPVGIVTVDHVYDIQWINGAARLLLGIHGSAVGHDFIHLASRLPSRELRSAIDAVFNGETRELEQELGPSETMAGRRWVRLVLRPHQPDGPEGPTSQVVIVVLDSTAEVTERRAQEANVVVERGRADELGEQVAALSQAYSGLLGANQELTNSNAELRSANEELLVANEEVQAATEEVETLNEELQATNEELETLNEELQATVEELNTTNDDLQARTLELQETADTLRLQRVEVDLAGLRMETALAATQAAVLIVDADGRPLRASPQWTALMAGGRLVDGEGQPVDGPRSLEQRAKVGDPFSVDLRYLPDDGPERPMRAVGTPIREGKRVRGGVVVLTPIEDD